MTSYATLRDNNSSTAEDGITSNSVTPSTPLDVASAVELQDNSYIKKMAAAPLTPDSFSESEREKMDSTPENIKKIDDVINEANNQHHHHHRAQHQQIDMPAAGLSPRSDHHQYYHHQNSSGFAATIGMGTAVGDSNSKMCLSKPACNNPKEGEGGNNNKALYANHLLLLSPFEECFFS